MTPALSVIVPVFNAGETVEQCLRALQRSEHRDTEVIVVDDGSTKPLPPQVASLCDRLVRLEHNAGPAAARNAGARQASAPLLFFLDADVVVETDTTRRVVEVFEDPAVAAMFCSYQEGTPEPNFASQYKNLQHHYTHQIAERDAATFCGGFGGIRRDVFESVGGFDERLRMMEDIDLGYRMHHAGHRTVLRADIQLTHLKRYSILGLVRSEIFGRAIPWTRIMLNRKVFRADLNLRENNIASVAVVWLALACLLVSPWWPALLAAAAGLLLAMVALNASFVRFVAKRRGALFALRTAAMLALFYLYSGLGAGLGVLTHIAEGHRPDPQPS